MVNSMSIETSHLYNNILQHQCGYNYKHEKHVRIYISDLEYTL